MIWKADNVFSPVIATPFFTPAFQQCQPGRNNCFNLGTRQAKMPHLPAGISDHHREATLPSVGALVTQLITQLEALSARIAQREEQMGCGSRNSSKPPSAAKAGILAPAATSSQRSRARMSSLLSPQPAAVAVRRSAVRIQNHTATCAE
jgi:hypothetical protein